MNEITRTLVYVAVAAVIGLVSWGTVSYTSPRIEKIDPDDETGLPFFPDFKDPLAATSMEIVEYDEKTLQTRQFKVERDSKGVWSIPSHSGYPADAARQLEEAAASVIDLKKLGVATDDKTEHALYGVVEPNLSSAASAAEGVGKSVTLAGEGGTLAEFIIGKQDPQQDDLHFVRLPDQDRVYRVAVNTSKLSTRFQDWIEKDLLKLNSFDIRQVLIDSYSVDEVNQRIDPGERVLAKYDDEAAKWTVDDLAAEEQVNQQKLNDLKSAIDTLQIVDVRRKPPGISADLRIAEDIRRPTEEEFRSLAARGYYVVPVRMRNPDGSEGIGEALLSDEGEVSIMCADGVVYRLRFGNIAANTGGGERGDDPDEEGAEEGAADEQAEDEEAGDPDANRYVFVTVEFDKSLIPEPELPPLPGEEAPAEEDAEPTADDDAEPAEEEAGPAEEEAGPAEEEAGPAEEDAATPDENAETPDGAAPEDSDEGAEPGDDCQVEAAEEEEAGEEPAPDETAGEAAEEESSEGTTEAADAEDSTAPVEGQPTDEQPAEGDADGETAIERMEREGAETMRQMAEMQRKQKLDEYNDNVTKGEERVKELNARFADWYYVISDAVYKRIHLTRADVIQQAPLDPAGGTGALEGLDLPADGPPAGDDPLGDDPDGEASEGNPPEGEERSEADEAADSELDSEIDETENGAAEPDSADAEVTEPESEAESPDSAPDNATEEP